MKVTYDPIADAIYIYLSEKRATRTEEIRDDLILDFSGKRLVGIEILDVSKKLSKKELGRVNLMLPTYRTEEFKGLAV